MGQRRPNPQAVSAGYLAGLHDRRGGHDSGGLVYVNTDCCSSSPIPRPARIASYADPGNTPMYFSPTLQVVNAPWMEVLRCLVKEVGRMSPRVMLALAVSAGALACGTAAVEPRAVGTATIEASVEAATSAVRVRIVNSGGAALVFSECPPILERSSGRRWVPVSLESLFRESGCPAVLRLLLPEASFEFQFPMPESSESGMYRLRVPQVWDRGENGVFGPQLPASRLISNSFALAAGS